MLLLLFSCQCLTLAQLLLVVATLFISDAGQVSSLSLALFLAQVIFKDAITKSATAQHQAQHYLPHLHIPLQLHATI